MKETEMSKLLGVSKTIICRYAKELGLPKRKPGFAHEPGSNDRRRVDVPCELLLDRANALVAKTEWLILRGQAEGQGWRLLSVQGLRGAEGRVLRVRRGRLPLREDKVVR